MYVAVLVTCILSHISAGVAAEEALNCTDCIIINSKAGNDNPSCRQSNTTYSTTPCKTLRYALNSTSLTSREIVLQGDLHISHTLTVSDVNGLTIRSDGKTNSTIHCKPPNTIADTGSGLLFVSLTNLRVFNVIFEGCGTLQLSTTVRNGINVRYRSAVYIINSTNITFSDTTFCKSVGRGLSLLDVGGFVEIKNSTFSENIVPKRELMALFGGGGIYIEFTYCTPGHISCDQAENYHNKRNSYVINDCVFEGNRATNNEVTSRVHDVQFRNLTGSNSNNAGQGGGIHITLKGTSFQNIIAVHNCVFHNNTAQYGGGLDAVLQDNSRENIINIRACTFINNLALNGSGGAINIGYTSGIHVSNNTIKIQDSHFISNSAGRGGGISFFSSRVRTINSNRLEFVDCTWNGNSASVGAAMSLRPIAGSSLFDGVTPITLLCRCLFINNRVVHTAAFLTSAGDSMTQHELESGVLHLESVEVKFKDFVSFNRSTGSAVVSTSSQINVLEGTLAEFVNNTAAYGGAMALLGFSILNLYPKSKIVFDSNHASELGGAVYATSPHQTEFIFSHTCFISYRFYAHPDEWNTSLIFINNTARYGYAIYTDSLRPCAMNIFDIETNVSSALQWTPFIYTQGIKPYTIATSPAVINFTIPATIAPGQEIDIQLMSADDLEQPILTSYQVFLDSTMEGTKTSPFLSTEDNLVIHGKPGTKFKLTLRTQNTRHISRNHTGELENCPLGFTLQNNRCVCSASNPDKALLGITTCNLSSFRAYLQLGYWAGCTKDDNIVTGHCTFGYCDYKSDTPSKNFLLPKTCKELNENTMCSQHRRGQLCGECEAGYTEYWNSDIFKCERCPYGFAGFFVIYIFAELLPLTFLFVGIMSIKLKMTSGPMQSLILFAQTINLINRVPLVTPLSETSYTFIRIHSFFLGFLSLEFFKLDEFSFCLWSGAAALDNHIVRYVTTLFAIVLICLYTLFAQHNSRIAKLTKILCCKNIESWVKKIKLFKNSIVHGIATFLILAYTQYTVASFWILSRLTLHGEGGKTLGSFVAAQGGVAYFGPKHLPYAIPAVLVLLCLTLPPPLLLISYPLLWRIKAKCRRNVETDDDTTVWPIRKLLPLIDSFQGVFRDNCRMFAGLFFLWRVIIIAIYFLSSDLALYYLMMEITLLLIFIIHVLARPYKRRLYNMIDAAMLANMATINALSWYISVSFGTSQAKDVAIVFKFILMYSPLVCLVAVIIFLILRKFGIVSEQMRFPNTEENEATKTEIGTMTAVRRMTVKERQDTCADEDLFSRAAEPNSAPLVLTGSEKGFELRSMETTNTTL